MFKAVKSLSRSPLCDMSGVVIQEVISLAWSPDGKMLASGSKPPTPHPSRPFTLPRYSSLLRSFSGLHAATAASVCEFSFTGV